MHCFSVTRCELFVYYNDRYSVLLANVMIFSISRTKKPEVTRVFVQVLKFD